MNRLFSRLFASALLPVALGACTASAPYGHKSETISTSHATMATMPLLAPAAPSANAVPRCERFAASIAQAEQIMSPTAAADFALAQDKMGQDRLDQQRQLAGQEIASATFDAAL